jgi:predicted ATPase
VKLTRFSVTNFRSITKAEKIPLGDLTVLLGPNNEGKSNLIEALAIGMHRLRHPAARLLRQGDRRRFRLNVSGDEQFTYNWDRDFPQALQDNPSGRTTLSFDFELTPSEMEEFHRVVGSRFNEVLPISLIFASGSEPQFKVRKQGRSQKALARKRIEIARFVADRVQLQYVPAIRTGRRATEIVQRLLSRELANAAEQPAMAAALEKVRELQRPTLEGVEDAIASRLRDFLPEVASVSIDAEETERALARSVSIVINDGVPTELELKGDGVQSLAALALMQHYSRETARAREFILAVEEPEAHLHPKAIRALKDTLKETSESQQVILTTHSPILVNRVELGSNVIVTKNQAKPATSVAELRDVLGVHVSDNLASAEVVLLVEGWTDHQAISSILGANERIQPFLSDGTLSVMPLHGATKLKNSLVDLQNSLAAIHAFLDDDDAGHAAAAAAKEASLVNTADLTFAMRQGAKKGCEFEDLIDSEVYKAQFQADFNVNLDHAWRNQMSKGKWSVRMATIFQASGAPWSKTLEDRAKQAAADCVAENPTSAIRQDCKGIIDALADAVVRKLEARS